MKHHTKQFFTLSLSLAVALVATALIANLALAGAPSVPVERPADINPIMISGTVVQPNGSLPVPLSTIVRIVDPEWLIDPRDSLVRGIAQVAPLTGDFSIVGVPPGNYLMRAQPPDISLFTPSPWQLLSVFTSSIYITPPLRLTNPVLTGTLYASNGISPVLGTVNVFSGALRLDSRKTDLNGNFTVGPLMTGTYRLEAEPHPDSFDVASAPKLVTLPPFPQYVTMTLNGPLVFGTVREPNGLPVNGAKVIASFAVSPTQVRVDVTGITGRYGVANVPVTPGVTVTLRIEPPLGREGLRPLTPTVVTLPQPLPVTLTFGVALKGVYGYVKTNTNQNVQNALVEANRIDKPGHIMTTTNVSGFYQMLLSPGLWAVNVHPLTGTTPTGWVYPFPARVVFFDDTPTFEPRLVDFIVLTPDATVKGNVVLPDGITPPSFTVTVGLHNDEGLGLAERIDASGNYTFRVPHGPYKLDARVESSLYAAPPPTIVHALSGTTIVVPPIKLIARDALITGTVTDANGMPVEGIPVVAWSSTEHATFFGSSGSDGVYGIGVFSGTWLVRPAPRPDQSYVYTGTAVETVVASNSIAPNVNFSLVTANATIHGIVVDDTGTPVFVRGWAGGTQVPIMPTSVVNGAPIEDGEFDIKVPTGTYAVKLNLPSSQDFMASHDALTLTVNAGETTTYTFALVRATAHFYGGAFDKRTNVSVNVDGRVGVRDGDLWASTDLKLGGFYTLTVAPGVWMLNYEIFSDKYLKATGPRAFAMTDNQTQTVGLPVLFKDAWITGTVMITRGGVLTPAIGAGVVAEGISTDVMGIVVRVPVLPDGRFFLRVPFGVYNVRSVMVPDPVLLNPALRRVLVPSGGVVGVNLVYRPPNALIVGTLSGTYPLTAPKYVVGWSADDGYNTALVRGNMYTLPVVSGVTWTVIAKAETFNYYWVTRTVVSNVPPGQTTANLNLVGPKLKPGPATIVFDPTVDRLIELADGTRIYIPAGAMPVSSGRVILHITPIANALHQRNGDVLGLRYTFEAFTEDGQPITDNFNYDVVITFKYDPAELMDRGINVNRVKPAYFSTTTNSWTAPDSFVVDETNNTITMQIDHFTDFALLSVESDTATFNSVYLPLVVR